MNWKEVFCGSVKNLQEKVEEIKSDDVSQTEKILSLEPIEVTIENIRKEIDEIESNKFEYKIKYLKKLIRKYGSLLSYERVCGINSSREPDSIQTIKEIDSIIDELLLSKDSDNDNLHP